MRSIYEVNQSMKADVMIVSTGIWTPARFLKAIADLSLWCLENRMICSPSCQHHHMTFLIFYWRIRMLLFDFSLVVLNYVVHRLLAYRPLEFLKLMPCQLSTINIEVLWWTWISLQEYPLYSRLVESPTPPQFGASERSSVASHPIIFLLIHVVSPIYNPGIDIDLPSIFIINVIGYMNFSLWLLLMIHTSNSTHVKST